ncbi:MAG: Fic family protein [Candidatus Accumulibacter sp.]|uniref:Fic family protein n=1 Tax=Accumulibacter sp. TaxID=2053492 RepID=UPI001AD560DA|nr:Fic family protein [Accumulibacter sp.]MBN8519981.1 Fic family protein [Accumulibacter sp.]MBO3713082.1 Fic family protein [Accumulibacter sp.]MCM8580499.1 Fic family protein [Accumulibacter sp.]
MNDGNKRFIWQQGDWPNWRFDHQRLAQPLAEVHQSQGRLLGRLHELGVGLREQATLQVLTEDVLKTSEIEGEKLNADSVRSSLARRLGVDIGGLAPVDRNVEGVVDMVLDATRQHASALTPERLFGWHAALFPTGYSGLSRIRVGAWRDDTLGPMQVVSGPLGRQKVHYEAPPAHSLAGEMSNFLCWFNGDQSADPVIKAGLAHLWLVTVHPFEDGNGRIARAVGDMALARGERSTQRFYSVSAQMQRERQDYYDWLERTQKGTLEVTDWLEWFVGCLLRAVDAAEETLAAVLTKASFWQRWAGTPMNERQIKLLNRLLDGFEGKLTSSKWAAIAKCSSDTALRDIHELLQRGVLVRSNAGGRSTHYALMPPESGREAPC